MKYKKEYVDFNTAFSYMLNGGQAKFNEDIYYLLGDSFWKINNINGHHEKTSMDFNKIISQTWELILKEWLNEI